MATLSKVASRGHHTFTLTVTETGDIDIASDGSYGKIKVDYLFTMYGGSWNFYGYSGSKQLYWSFKIGENTISGSFGRYDAYQTLEIARGSCWVTQTSNGA